MEMPGGNADSADQAEPDEEEPVNFDEPPRVDGIEQGQIEAIIGRFRTQRISVAALLARARYWRLGDDTLTIAFADDFGASALATDREAVQQEALSILGRESLAVRITTLGEIGDEAGGPEDDSGRDEPGVEPEVEMVRKVFRGEIVEGQA
jgi:hypothetical protein